MINGMILGLFFSWHNILPAKYYPKYHFSRPVFVYHKPLPFPTRPYFPKPTATPKPTRIPTPTPTSIPTPTPTSIPTPTPTIIPAKINSVVLHFCSKDSSCYGWTTGVEINGTGFAEDTRTTLVKNSVTYTGFYQGGNSNQVLTDFYNLPLCSTFDAVVSGSTGNVTSSASVSTLCP